MSRLAFLVFALSISSSVAFSQGRPPRFWNLTHGRISEFYLAAAGTTAWGPNQAKNDKDGVVDPDERLRITGIKSGSYDAKLTDLDGRTCNENTKAVARRRSGRHPDELAPGRHRAHAGAGGRHDVRARPECRQGA